MGNNNTVSVKTEKIVEAAYTNIGLHNALDLPNDRNILTIKDIGDRIKVIIPGNLYLIDKFISDDECEKLIKIAEETGFKDATVNIGNGIGVIDKGYRDSKRCMIDDVKAAEIIFERAKNVLPIVSEGGILSCVNERLRILKYTKGNKFEKHCDGFFPREINGINERSVLTLHLYLNEDSVGGATIFYNHPSFGKDNEFICHPKKGRLAIFRQNKFWHCGEEVKSGTKYTIRTDVMYRAISNKYENTIKTCNLCCSDVIQSICSGSGHIVLTCKCSNSLYEDYYRCVSCNDNILIKI